MKPPEPADRKATAAAANGGESQALDAAVSPCREISAPAVMAIQPLVSVKMRTYNHEPYVARAIEGVLAQKTDFPIELVIGDDCSTDRTREIVLRFQRDHPDIIRALLWDRNVGARRNSRKLDELLRGKYTAFNDGDDYWTHPRKLQMQVDIMEANPDVGLVHAGIRRFDVVSGELLPWKPRPSDYDEGNILDKYLRGRYHISVPAACVRTELYRAVLRDNPDEFDGRFMMSDMQMWLELSRISKFRFINEPLTTYNLLPESVSRSRDLQKEIRFWKSALEMCLHYVDKYQVDKATELHLRSSYARLFRVYLSRARGRKLADLAWGTLKSTDAHMGLRELVLYWNARNAFVRLALETLRRAGSVLRR